MINPQTLFIILPELEIAIFGLICLVAAAACGARVTRHIGILALVAFALAGVTIYTPARFLFLLDGIMPVFAFGGQLIENSFTRFVMAVLLAASSCSILLSWSNFEKDKSARAEYPVLIIFATLGMMLMVAANDLMSLYIGLELQSLALYVLAAFRRDDKISTEAGVKYFVLGAIASGLLLYGASLIYGFGGTTDFVSITIAMMDKVPQNGMVIGMVFVCAALAFKVSAVPFHMWAPDVYEGAPTPVTAFFASAPKIAALAVFARFVLEPMHLLADAGRQIIVFISIASMLWGAFAGLMQNNVKRLLAYSSIANVGFLLVGIAVGGKTGMQALLIYATIYVVNSLGVFAVLLCLRRNGRDCLQINDLAGLSRTNPMLAFGMAVMMFSMAGVPPLAGFFGKYFMFLAAVDADMMPLAIIGVLCSVVTAYYYLRIIKVMYFDESAGAMDVLPDWGVRTVFGLTTAAIVGLVLMPSPLIDGASKAVKGWFFMG